MLAKEQFLTMCAKGPVILDGATGSNLRKVGMPKACCTEQWVLDHIEKLRKSRCRSRGL